jgi:hypothetical protein
MESQISEDDREGESTIDCYERRAVVSALLRVQWMLTPNALGRPALMPECMRESAPPSYLEASSLAPHLRNIPRGTREEMSVFHHAASPPTGAHTHTGTCSDCGTQWRA